VSSADEEDGIDGESLSDSDEAVNVLGGEEEGLTDSRALDVRPSPLRMGLRPFGDGGDAPEPKRLRTTDGAGH